MKERQLHDAFKAWLKKRGIPYIYGGWGTKSTMTVGWPDFTILWMGRAVCIEIKTPKGKTQEVQDKAIEFIRAAGNRVVLARSLEQCTEATMDILKENPLPVIPAPPRPEVLTAKDAKCAKGEEGLFVGEMHGKPTVFAPVAGGGVRFVRTATEGDLQLLKRGQD